MARAKSYYVTSIDRLGLAIAVGGALGGFIVSALAMAGGARASWAVIVAWLVGALCSMAAIVTIVGPLWLALHRMGRRGPAIATLASAGVALVIVGVVLLLPGAPLDRYRVASVLATAGLAALVAGAIGWIMHRIAYSRLM